MTTFAIIILFIGNIGLFYLVWALHEKLEKLNKNQAIMLEWFESIKKNEETLQDTLKKLYREFHASEKEIHQKERVAPQAKESVRSR